MASVKDVLLSKKDHMTLANLSDILYLYNVSDLALDKRFVY
jgi:hypothetical protein